MKCTTLYLVSSVNCSALLPTQCLSKLEVVSSEVWHRSRWRGGRSNCLTVQSSLGVLGAAILAPLQILVSGSLARPSLQQKSLKVVFGLCWFILSIGHLLLPPDFLPSVIYPLLNLLACHLVSLCQRTVTKKIGQSWPTAKVLEELCRTPEEYAPKESNHVRYCVGSAFLNPQFFTLL